MSKIPVERVKPKKLPTGIYTAKLRMTTPKELAAQYLRELDKTPKWRVLKRRQLKRTINYWGRQG